MFNPRRNHRAALDTAEYGGITACSARTSHGEPTTGKLRVFGAFGTALSPLVGGQLGVTTSPNPVVPEFPHLAPTGHEDIPALADLFGLASTLRSSRPADAADTVPQTARSRAARDGI